MYYEARTHRLKNVASPTEAANLLKSGELSTCEVTTWIDSETTEQVFAVPDGHINNMLSEIALLIKREDNYYQIESLTNSRMSEEALANDFANFPSEPSIFKKTQLIVGSPTAEQTAYFECGCCGKSFNDNVKKQLEFDQDAGYGICDSCSIYYK